MERRGSDASRETASSLTAVHRHEPVLCQMSLEHRTVLLLVEMEQLTAPEVADLLGVPLGTVASRLRRARAEFNRRLARIEAALGRSGGSP